LSSAIDYATIDEASTVRIRKIRRRREEEKRREEQAREKRRERKGPK
jgi:hypothetical protein